MLIKKLLNIWSKYIGDKGLVLNEKPRPFASIFSIKGNKTVIVFNTLIASICFALFVFGLFTSSKTKTEYSLKQFYPTDHPLLIEEQKVAQIFKLEKNLSIIVLLQTLDKKSWLENQHYEDLKKLTTAFQASEKLKSINSLATLQGAQDSGEQLDVGALFENKDFTVRKSIADHHPFVKPHLLSKDEQSTLLVLSLNPASPLEIAEYTRNLKSYFDINFPDYKIEIGGLSALQADMSTLLKKELLRSVLIGFFLFVLGLLLIYKKPTHVISVLATLVFVNVVVLGFLAYFKISLNVLLTTLPILISLAVISLVIHIQSHHSKSKNIFITYKDLFWENLLAVLTTSVGFLFLKTSSSLLIQNYGLVVAGSSLAAWFLTHLVYWPLSFYFYDIQFKDWLSKPAYWSLWSLKYKKTFLTLGFSVFILGSYSLTKINWNSRALDDLPEHQDTRRTTEFLDQNFGGTLEMNFVIHRLNKNFNWSQAKSIQKLDVAISRIKKIKAVGSAISANDYYRSLSSPVKSSRMPASNADLSEKNFLFSLSSKNPIDSVVSENKQDLLIKVRYKDLPSNKINLTTHRINSILKKYFPEAKITNSGFAEQFHKLNKEISKDLVFGFWQALLLAGIILMFVFKSWRLALLACLPNMLPPFTLLIWLNYQQVSLKPTVAIIFSIAIGLAFTNTVYIIGRILKLKKQFGNIEYLPLKQALLEEGNPCLLATLLVVLGFVVFLFSYFGVNRLFGQYMILSVAAALAGDLIFMPSFLQQFKKYFVSILFLFLFFPNTSSASKELAAAEILKKTQTNLASKDDSASITMKIIEADGSSKERQMTLKRKFSAKKNQVLVKIQKPIDQRGAGFLNIFDNGTEQQWLYLPNSKQVRRFISKNKQEGVLGSELSPQDLDITTVQAATAKLIKTEKTLSGSNAVIEVNSKSNQTAYSRAILWIDVTKFVPLRIEYYDAKGLSTKRIEFDKYTLVNSVQRAQKIVIKNTKNNRSTELILSNVKVNIGLKDDDFTQRALSKD